MNRQITTVKPSSYLPTLITLPSHHTQPNHLPITPIQPTYLLPYLSLSLFPSTYLHPTSSSPFIFHFSYIISLSHFPFSPLPIFSFTTSFFHFFPPTHSLPAMPLPASLFSFTLSKTFSLLSPFRFGSNFQAAVRRKMKSGKSGGYYYLVWELSSISFARGGGVNGSDFY